MNTIVKKVDRAAAKNAEYFRAVAAQARADLDYIAMMCDVELDTGSDELEEYDDI